MLRILHLEDNKTDAELILRMLEQGGLSCRITRVETKERFLQALENQGFDLIISDFTLPSYDGLSALSAARRKAPEVPFIFVSATIGEDKAIESLVEGATDYVLKTKLSRLVPAIRRAFREAEERKERVGAENALRDSEASFRLLFASNPHPMWVYDRQTLQFIEVNEAAIAKYGYSRDEFLRMRITDIRPPEDVPRLLEEVKRDRPAIEHSTAWRHRLKNGEIIDVEITSHTLEFGGRHAVLVVAQDTTKRKRAEEALRKSEERYRRFFEEDPTGDYITRPDGTIIACNPAFARIFGFASAHDALNQNARLLYKTPQDFDRMVQLIYRSRKLEYYECERQRTDSKVIHAVENIYGTFDEQNHLVEIKGYLFDDTRRKELERQLYQAQKLESIGTLAGGIAHDFNNILGIILGHLTIIQSKLSGPKELAESAGTITQAVHRGASLVRQILTFARKTDIELGLVQVNTVVREVAKMLRETFPKTINISPALDDTIPPIAMDQSQLHQALLNLCVNARDAMTGTPPTRLPQGTLTIRTAQIPAGILKEKFPESGETPFICISVADTGTGMDETVKGKIFEPFFTTKEPGVGTGLGLAVVYGVVKNHQGFVDVKSTVGKGATFKLYFPVKTRVTEAVQVDHEKSDAALTGTETILLVEDEQNLLDMMRIFLESNNYHIVTAQDGIQAIEQFTAHKDEIALVVADMGLPKLDGAAVFATMKEIKPAVKVLLTSGYVDAGQQSALLKAGAKGFIQKPYQPNDVLRRIREAIDT